MTTMAEPCDKCGKIDANKCQECNPEVIQHSDELVSRTPSEKAAYLEGVAHGKMYAVRDGLTREDVGLKPLENSKDSVTREQVQSWAKLAGFTVWTESNLEKLGDFAIFARKDREIPADCDVRKIMLRVVPGDGSGQEVYARNVAEVEGLLSDMGLKLEEFELNAMSKGMSEERIADTWTNVSGRPFNKGSTADEFASALLSDQSVAFAKLQRDYAALKSLCVRAETAAAEAQVEIKRLRSAPAEAEPIVKIVAGWQLVYVGASPLATLVERHGLKIGDYLYAGKPVEAQRPEHVATVDSLGATRIVWNGAVCKGGLPEGTQLYSEPQAEHDLSLLRNAFRVTETEGDPDPSKQRFHMRFTFRSLEELHKADDQWRAFSQEAK
jgi:hypothetical protein